VGLPLAGWLLLKRRRSAEELATVEVWLDSEDWLDRNDADADWEAMLAELARGRLGLRECRVGAEAAVSVWVAAMSKRQESGDRYAQTDHGEVRRPQAEVAGPRLAGGGAGGVGAPIRPGHAALAAAGL
jgi:hypothetical protein